MAPISRFAAACAAFAVAVLLDPRPEARAQQVKPRVMVLLDNSGSMGFHFADPVTFAPPPNGDYPGGDGSTSYTDANNNGVNWFPGKLLGNGTRDGVNSRLYAAKAALNDALNAYSGDVDFGLATYDFSLCPLTSPLCAQCAIQCFGLSCSYNCLYTDPGFTTLVRINNNSATCTGNGAKILALPAAGSPALIRPWIDGVEVWKANAQGQVTNPELRANGATPLAQAITALQTTWYDPIKNAAQGSANYDAQLSCRPYVLVVETDGVDDCSGNTANAAQLLYQDNAANPVLTYVIGLSIQQSDQANLNATAAAGGTGQARFASSQAQIEAAYADILARSIKPELCNGKDDNCNGLIDEGFDKGAACSVGVGACLRSGVKKCDPNNDTQTACCVNDGSPTCTPLVPGTPTMEICDGIDNNCNGLIDEGGVCQTERCVQETCNGLDDDCDGIVDDHLVDVNEACGLNIGICKPGTTACVNGMGMDVGKGATPDKTDHLVCQGGVMPQMEVCNGLDDDCDGVVDGMSRTCYDGKMGTDNVGVCHDGLQRCTATLGSGVAMWGMCVGEVVPGTEICNGQDDDCDGVIDDVPGAGASCCPSMRCGVGICTAGTMQCSGGSLACVGGQGPEGEVCNGKDDDCNGLVDDLPSVGKSCTAQNSCPGKLACDVTQMAIVCQATQMNCTQTCAQSPMLNTPCGPYVGLPLPCMAGTYSCANDRLTCSGGVGPTPEACNCKDDDCNGKVDDNAFCPQGTDCVSCGCYARCTPGEFPCPGGYDCIDVQKKSSCDNNGDPNEPCYCIPEETCDPPCSPDETCEQQPPPATHGVCVNKCQGVTCNDPYVCKGGLCESCTEDPSLCKTCAGGAGERCDPVSHKCVPDLCCGVTCMGGTCQPLSGQCTKSCANVTCDAGQVCVDGACTMNKCTGVSCPELQSCDPQSGTCMRDACRSMDCPFQQTCCQGACMQDPCTLVHCGPGYKCKVDTLTCNVTCDQPSVPTADQDRVVGAGGGGLALGCSVARGGRPNYGAREGGKDRGGDGGLALALGLGLVGALVAGRRRRMPR